MSPSSVGLQPGEEEIFSTRHAPDTINASCPLNPCHLAESNLPLQNVSLNSECNLAEPVSHIGNSRKCTTKGYSCNPTAFTVLVDNEIVIFLKIQEPPHPLLSASQIRYLLRTSSDWHFPPRHDYLLPISLQPGLNHITWCKHSSHDTTLSPSPPFCGDDWPTIFPHPLSSSHTLHFYSLLPHPVSNHLSYELVPPIQFASFPLQGHLHPPHISVYHHSRTVPSLTLLATLMTISQGYLTPDKRSNLSVPLRLVDETFHSLHTV